MNFTYDSSLVPMDALDEAEKILSKEIFAINQASNTGYDSDYGSINLSLDKDARDNVKSLVERMSGAQAIIVVGIGGSNLGTIAVHEAINGKLYNINSSPKIFFADTVDNDSMNSIISIMKRYLENNQRVILNVISKSGGTTETIANFELLLMVLKEYRSEYKKDVVVTTDEKSEFWNIALSEGFQVLGIPKKVGGRYSVFSAVGLFPLAYIGIDIDALHSGASNMRTECLNSFKQNPAAISAALQHYHYTHGKNISDTFLFISDFESIGKWYRQLMGESIGKEYDKSHQNRILCGMTPTVSVGSTDLHSMAQLYLGGPYDKFTTFVKLDQKEGLSVPNMPVYDKLVSHIQGKPLPVLMNAIIAGVQTAFSQQQRPYCTMTISDRSVQSIGALLQWKMMEMMYLGFLLGVNPFDQPNVEQYKTETKRIMKEKSY